MAVLVWTFWSIFIRELRTQRSSELKLLVLCRPASSPLRGMAESTCCASPRRITPSYATCTSPRPSRSCTASTLTTYRHIIMHSGCAVVVQCTLYTHPLHWHHQTTPHAHPTSRRLLLVRVGPAAVEAEIVGLDLGGLAGRWAPDPARCRSWPAAVAGKSAWEWDGLS